MKREKQSLWKGPGSLLSAEGRRTVCVCVATGWPAVALISLTFQRHHGSTYGVGGQEWHRQTHTEFTLAPMNWCLVCMDLVLPWKTIKCTEALHWENTLRRVCSWTHSASWCKRRPVDTWEAEMLICHLITIISTNQLERSHGRPADAACMDFSRIITHGLCQHPKLESRLIIACDNSVPCFWLWTHLHTLHSVWMSCFH